jgi:hypothetical protein
MSLDFVQSLVKGKKSLWNFEFPMKVIGRQATLGGIGPKALTLKLAPSKAYPHLDIKAFLSWDKYQEFTKEEKELVELLIKELNQ